MPQATITYKLTATGQKAAIIAGLPGTAIQKLTLDVPSENVALFDISRDGALSADYQYTHSLDAPLTPDTALAFAVEAANNRASEAEARAKRQAAEKVVADEKRAAMTAAALEIVQADATATDKRILVRDITTGRIAVVLGINYGEQIEMDAREDAYAAVWVETYKARLEADKAAAAVSQAAEEIRKTVFANIPGAPKANINPTAEVILDGQIKANIPTSIGSDWAKLVTSVDIKGGDGSAFDGTWLHAGGSFVGDAGDIVVVGGKRWDGSKRGGSYTKERSLYILTRVGLIGMPGNSPSDAAILLTMDPNDRVVKALAAKIERSLPIREKCSAALSAEVPAELKAEYDENLAAVTAAWDDLLAKLKAELDIANRPPAIESVEAAARAIIVAGFKALAILHHPDRGGDTMTMAMVNEAHKQLLAVLEMTVEAAA